MGARRNADGRSELCMFHRFLFFSCCVQMHCLYALPSMWSIPYCTAPPMATDGERSHRRHGQLDGESEVAVNGESWEPAARLAHSQFGNMSHERGHQEKLHHFFVLFCTFKVRNFTFSYLFLPFLPLKSQNIKKKYKKVKKSDDTFPDGLPSFAASKPLIRRLQRQTQDRNLK